MITFPPNHTYTTYWPRYILVLKKAFSFEKKRLYVCKDSNLFKGKPTFLNTKTERSEGEDKILKNHARLLKYFYREHTLTSPSFG